MSGRGVSAGRGGASDRVTPPRLALADLGRPALTTGARAALRDTMDWVLCFKARELDVQEFPTGNHHQVEDRAAACAAGRSRGRDVWPELRWTAPPSLRVAAIPSRLTELPFRKRKSVMKRPGVLSPWL